MKNHFASTASTITAALLSGSAHGDSVVVLNDEDIASRHDSVQTRTCEGGFAVTGIGEFSLSKTDASFSVHVCAEDHTSNTSEGGGVAMAPGSVRVVSGKIFYSTKEGDMTSEFLYHPHCMYIDEEGGVFVGVEIQEITGDYFNVVRSQTKDEGDDNDRKLGAGPQSKSPKSSKAAKSDPPDDCYDRKLIHANEEVTSGNEPKGTLGISYFQRKEDFTEDHARYGFSILDEFDTACSDFADVVSRTDMMYMSEVTQGGFLFQEPLTVDL